MRLPLLRLPPLATPAPSRHTPTARKPPANGRPPSPAGPHAAPRLEALFYDSTAAPYAKLGAAVALHGAATLCSYARTAGGYYARAVAAPGSLAAPAVAAVLAWRGRTRVFPLASGIRAAAAAPS